MEELGINTEELFEKIEDTIIKACIACEPDMLSNSCKVFEHRNNCFELFGFDILIDEKLKPWLIECNVCPSLSSSSPLDSKLKTTLICDILNLLGL